MTAAAKTRWSWRPACPVSVGIWLAVVVLAFPLVPGAQAQSPYETPPVMKVTDLAPAGLIVGQGYRVGENVPTTGLLSKKLTHVAWVTFSAREAVNLTTAVVMPYSMVMSTVSLTNNLIWDMKPADLVALNQKKATDMGAGDEAASALIANKNYSTSALTALRTALPHPGTGRRGGAGGNGGERGPGPLPHGFRPDAGAPSYEWVTPLATMMARGTMVGKTATGGLVVGAPVDYVVWTENVDNFARAPRQPSRTEEFDP